MTLEYINFAYTEETCFLHSTGDSETEVELDCSTEIEEKPLAVVAVPHRSAFRPRCALRRALYAAAPQVNSRLSHPVTPRTLI